MFVSSALFVVMIEMILSFLVVAGCLETSGTISLAFNLLASITDSKYFCFSYVCFSLKSFSSAFSSSTIVHIILANENDIFCYVVAWVV